MAQNMYDLITARSNNNTERRKKEEEIVMMMMMMMSLSHHSNTQTHKHNHNLFVEHVCQCKHVHTQDMISRKWILLELHHIPG